MLAALPHGRIAFLPTLAGLFLLRNNPNTIKWVHAWLALSDTWKGAIQTAAYNLTRVGPVRPHPQDPRIFTAWNSTLYLGIVPPFLFANGHTYVIQKLHEVSTMDPPGPPAFKALLRKQAFADWRAAC